ncbi:MAG: hypothetical protein M0C28_21190 [Candidatus Moduliflexus flocculans]|nr:hypothetical protein [Candidatus Moduliflexus flocculans]
MKTPGGGLDLERFQQDQRIIAVISEVSQALIFHMPLDKLLRPHHGRPHPAPADGPGRPHAEEPGDRGLRAQGRPGPERGPADPEHLRQPDDRPHGPGAAPRPSSSRTSRPTTHLRAQASVVQAQIHSAMCVPLCYNRRHHRPHLLRPGLPPRAVHGERPAPADAPGQPGRQSRSRTPASSRIQREADRIRAGDGPGRPDPEELPAAQGPRLRALRHHRQRPGLPPRRRRLLRLHPHRRRPPGRHHRRRLGRRGQRFPAHGQRCGAPCTRSSPTDFDLGELTAGLNDFIYTSSDSHCFITFFLGILDRRTHELRLRQRRPQPAAPRRAAKGRP